MAERGRAGTAALEPPSLRLESKCARQSPASPQKCMWMALFGRKRPVLDDPYFGRLTFMRGGYWEGEFVVPGVSEKVGLVVPASETGPSEERQRSVGGYSRISTPSLRVVVRCSRATSSCERKSRSLPSGKRTSHSLASGSPKPARTRTHGMSVTSWMPRTTTSRPTSKADAQAM
jgi:hypothetical protein